MSERALIKRIAAAFKDASASDLGLDDCAQMPALVEGEKRVVSTDNFIEGVHFKNGPLQSAGHRALVRNLSDLAAAGATPKGFVWSLTLAEDSRVNDAGLDAFLEGAAQAAKAFACPLLGGDLSKSNRFSATVTIFGDAPKPFDRRHAKVGDTIYLSSQVGASMRGLALIEELASRADFEESNFEALVATLNPADQACVQAHLWPRPAIEEAIKMRGHVNACIDVSDGLQIDLRRLCESSGVSAHVEEDLAYAKGCTRSGDDYVILYTSASSTEGVRIGEVRKGAGVFGLSETSGFDHFASP